MLNEKSNTDHSTSAGAVFDEFIRLKNAPSYSLKDSTKNGKNRSSAPIHSSIPINTVANAVRKHTITWLTI